MKCKCCNKKLTKYEIYRFDDICEGCYYKELIGGKEVHQEDYDRLEKE